MVVCLSGFTSCKSKKNLQNVNSEGTLSKKEALARFLSPASYNFYAAKAKLRVTSPYGTDKGTLYIRSIPDSLIWMSVKRLSIEGGRILITPDSVTFINRLEKSYSKVSLEEIGSRYGIAADFRYIQNVILGFNPTVLDSEITDYVEHENVYTLSTMLNDIYHEFDLEKNHGNTVSGRFNERFHADGKWEFDDFRILSDITIPFKRNYHIQSVEIRDLHINIDFSDIELNNPKEIKFSVPNHYDKIDL